MPSEIADLIRGMAQANADAVRLGMQSTDARYRNALGALEKELQRALLDPQTKIPSSLQVSIAAVCALAHE